MWWNRFQCWVFGHVPDEGVFELEDQQKVRLVYHCERCEKRLGHENWRAKW